MGQLDDERRAIESYFETAWAGRTLLRFENTRFETPTGDPPPPWVALTIRSGEQRIASLGPNALVRSVGLAIVQIFTAERTGSGVARGYADQASDLFRDPVGSTNPRTVSYGASGPITFATEDGRVSYAEILGVREGWFQVNVIAPYRRSV